MPNLDLRSGARTRVWLRTLEIMKSDPVLSSTIRTWITWDGNKLSAADLSSMCPALRLEPNIGPMSWYSPDAQYGPLVVKLGLVIQSRYAEDYLNLWDAIEDSLYPYGLPDRQLQVQQSLRDAGAETGQWEFSAPAAEPDPREVEEGTFACAGSMRISVVRSFNP